MSCSPSISELTQRIQILEERLLYKTRENEYLRMGSPQDSLLGYSNINTPKKIEKNWENSDYQQKITDLEQKNLFLLRENEHFKKLTQNKDIIDLKTTRILEFEEKIERLVSENEKLNHLCREKTEENKLLCIQISQINRKPEKENNSQINGFMIENSKLHQLLFDKDQEISKLKAFSQQNEVKHLQRQISLIETDYLSKLQAKDLETKSKSDEIKDLMKNINDLNKENTRILAENKELQCNIEEIQNKIEINKSFNIKKNETNENNIDLLTNLTLLSAENDRLHAVLTEYKYSFSLNNDQSLLISQLNGQIESLSLENSNLNQMLKEKLSIISQEISQRRELELMYSELYTLYQKSSIGINKNSMNNFSQY